MAAPAALHALAAPAQAYIRRCDRRVVQQVLQCLKKRGQRLDLELAAEMRVPLATVRKLLAELAAAGEVVMYQLTRYEGSKTIEAWQCRVLGYVPAPAPGRKPKAA